MEYMVRWMWTEKAHGGYRRVEVSEWSFGCSRPDNVVDVTLWNNGRVSQCDCQGDGERDAKCPHVAIVKTWKRQKQERVNRLIMESRLYQINEEGRIGYWKNGKLVNLSLWTKVVGLKGV